ncbi:MAG: peptidylprolyl isomerase [Gemmatimonas sp.]
MTRMRAGFLLSAITTAMTLAACGGSESRPAAKVDSAAVAPVGPPAALVNPNPDSLTARAPDKFTLVLVTSRGEMEIAVERALAPLGVDRLYYLASHGFYDQSKFFRVVHEFVAQFGLSGIPAVDQVFDTLNLDDDPPRMSNGRGTVAFAKNGPRSRSTQLFISLKNNAAVLDRQEFAPIGKVVRGMEAADSLLSTYADLPNKPGPLLQRGNDYLRSRYPELDSVISVTVKK